MNEEKSSTKEVDLNEVPQGVTLNDYINKYVVTGTSNAGSTGATLAGSSGTWYDPDNYSGVTSFNWEPITKGPATIIAPESQGKEIELREKAIEAACKAFGYREVDLTEFGNALDYFYNYLKYGNKIKFNN